MLCVEKKVENYFFYEEKREEKKKVFWKMKKSLEEVWTWNLEIFTLGRWKILKVGISFGAEEDEDPNAIKLLSWSPNWYLPLLFVLFFINWPAEPLFVPLHINNTTTTSKLIIIKIIKKKLSCIMSHNEMWRT